MKKLEEKELFGINGGVDVLHYPPGSHSYPTSAGVYVSGKNFHVVTEDRIVNPQTLKKYNINGVTHYHF